MEIERSEIIKQFTYWIEGLDYPIHSRISKLDDGRFTWEISHHYSPEKGRDVYYPSASVGHRLEEMEHVLDEYVKNFTAEFEVEETRHYYAFKKPSTK